MSHVQPQHSDSARWRVAGVKRAECAGEQRRWLLNAFYRRELVRERQQRTYDFIQLPAGTPQGLRLVC